MQWLVINSFGNVWRACTVRCMCMVLCTICVRVCVCACACVCACVLHACGLRYSLVMSGWVYTSNTLALVRLYPSWSRMLILPIGHAHIIHFCFNMSHLRKALSLFSLKMYTTYASNNAHNNSLSR